jgi:hypothetical protein
MRRSSKTHRPDRATPDTPARMCLASPALVCTVTRRSEKARSTDGEGGDSETASVGALSPLSCLRLLCACTALTPALPRMRAVRAGVESGAAIAAAPMRKSASWPMVFSPTSGGRGSGGKKWSGDRSGIASTLITLISLCRFPGAYKAHAHTTQARTHSRSRIYMGLSKRKIDDEGGGRPSKRSSLDLATADRPLHTISVGPWSLSLRQRHW